MYISSLHTYVATQFVHIDIIADTYVDLFIVFLFVINIVSHIYIAINIIHRYEF